MEHDTFVKCCYKTGKTRKKTNNLLKVTLGTEISSRLLQTFEKSLRITER
jgi:hypothetical protein